MIPGGRGYLIECGNDFSSPMNAEDVEEEVPYDISVSDGVPQTESRITSHQLKKQSS